MALCLGLILLIASCATSDNMQFHDALNAGDLPQVKAWLAKGMEADKPFPSSNTPLKIAAEIEHEEMIKYLLRKGANIDAQDRAGQTALYIASALGRELSVYTLIDAGADVEIPNNNGLTPLMNASGDGSEGIVRALLDAHADVNYTNNRGQTALNQAFNRATSMTLNDHVDDNGESTQRFSISLPYTDGVARILLEAGADTNGFSQAVFAKQVREGRSYIEPIEFLQMRLEFAAETDEGFGRFKIFPN